MKFLAGIEMVGGKGTEEERVLSLDEIKGFFTAVDDKMAASRIGSFPPCALKQEGKRLAMRQLPAGYVKALRFVSHCA
jgi:hypothetical protein